MKILIVLVIFFTTLIFEMNHRWIEKNQLRKEKKTILLAPPQYIKHFSFGFRESMADSLWLRFIQDIELCGKKKITRSKSEKLMKRSVAGVDSLSLETAHISKILNATESDVVCDKGWTFELLDAVTNLSPKFKVAYTLGAPSLSVLAFDPRGAKVIFDKGVRQYPKDWSILYRAAYHYLYEVKEPGLAAELMLRAGDSGGPSWLRSLASRLYTKSGQVSLGLLVLKDYYKKTKNPEYKKKILARIKTLERHLKK